MIQEHVNSTQLHCCPWWHLQVLVNQRFSTKSSNHPQKWQTFRILFCDQLHVVRWTCTRLISKEYVPTEKKILSKTIFIPAQQKQRTIQRSDWSVTTRERKKSWSLETCFQEQTSAVGNDGWITNKPVINKPARKIYDCYLYKASKFHMTANWLSSEQWFIGAGCKF